MGTFPIGIDVDRVETMRKDKDVQFKMKAIADMYTGKKIIVGRDKLDLVKGVIQKLAAFEKFLMDYPEWRDQVGVVVMERKKQGLTLLVLGSVDPSDRW